MYCIYKKNIVSLVRKIVRTVVVTNFVNTCAVLGVSICIFVVATLVSIKVHISRRNFQKKEGPLLHSVADF